MAEQNQIEIQIVLDDGSVRSGFATIRSEGEKTSSFLSRAFSIKSFTDLNFAVGAVKNAISSLNSVLRDSISESLGGEQATLKLASAISSVPGATDDAVKSFKSFSSELSGLVGIDDDVINANAALLASLGRLKGDGLEEATKAALDLSAGLNISVEDAFRRVAIAAEGNVGSLSKIGFEFTKGASNAQVLSEALQQIKQRFGGLSEAQAGGTFQGVLNSLTVAFGDLKQSIGDVITRSPAIRELIKFITEGFVSLTRSVVELSSNGGFNELVINTVRFGKNIVDYVIKPIEVLGQVGIKVFELLKASFDVLINAAFELAGGIANLFLLVGVDNPVVRSVLEIRDATREVANESVANLYDFKGFLETPVSNQLSTSMAQLTQRLIAANPVLDSTKAKVSEVTESMTKDFSDAAKSINTSFQQGIIKTISAGAQTIGASLVNGSSAFKEFGKLVLGIIGDMAIQIGSTLVGIGIGIENLKLALATLSGGAAIAAGLALIALGGALKALSGGGISASGGGGYYGTPDTGGGFAPPPAAVEETTQTRQPKQELVVNVNGDILGDESAGRRLVELMNSAFDASGVKLREGIV